MIVNGLIKLTLLDYPGKIAATVFLAGCNFMCPYCHNASLVQRPQRAERIEQGDLFSFLERRRGKLEGVCISGGEPTLNSELPELARKIKALGYALKIDTNGTSPDVIRGLIDEKIVDYIAMDIKNSLRKYPKTTGISNLDTSQIEESVALLIERGDAKEVDYEFRTTVAKDFHEDEDFHEIGAWLAGARRYFLQKLICSADLIVPGTVGYDDEKMLEFLKIVRNYIPGAQTGGM